MENNNVVEVLTNIERKLESSSFVAFAKEVKPNINSKLQQNIDRLQNKIDDPNNYIDDSVKAQENMIVKELESKKLEKSEIEKEISLIAEKRIYINRTIEMTQMELDTINRNIDRNESGLNFVDPEFLKKKNDTFDEEQRRHVCLGILEENKVLLQDYERKVLELREREAKLDESIYEYEVKVEKFQQNRDNALDDVQRRKDEDELNIYKLTLEKYNILEKSLKYPYLDKISKLIENPSSREVKETIDEMNRNLKVDVTLTSSERIATCKNLFDELNDKVNDDSNYKLDVDLSNDRLLNELESKKNKCLKKLENDREELELTRGLIGWLDAETHIKDNCVLDLYNRTGEYTSSLDPSKSQEVKEQIEEFKQDIENYKNTKKRYANEKKFLEESIARTDELAQAYEGLYNERVNTLSDRKPVNVYAREIDREKAEDLASCLKILEFDSKSIDVTLDEELNFLNEQTFIDNEALAENQASVVENTEQVIETKVPEEPVITEAQTLESTSALNSVVENVESTPVIEEPVVEKTLIETQPEQVIPETVSETPTVEEQVLNPIPVMDMKLEEPVIEEVAAPIEQVQPFSFEVPETTPILNPEAKNVESTPVIEEPVVGETLTEEVSAGETPVAPIEEVQPFSFEIPTEEQPIVEEPVNEETVESLQEAPVTAEVQPLEELPVIEEEPKVEEAPTLEEVQPFTFEMPQGEQSSTEEDLEKTAELSLSEIDPFLSKNVQEQPLEEVKLDPDSISDEEKTATIADLNKELEQENNNSDVQVDVGDESLAFEQSLASEYVEPQEWDFEDNGVYNTKLAAKARTKEFVSSLGSFFDTQEASLSGIPEVSAVLTTNPDEITLNASDGTAYDFDLGKDAKEDTQSEVHEYTIDELYAMKDQMTGLTNEYEGGAYGK